jgi:single-stranded-DNA-specific exonuclease
MNTIILKNTCESARNAALSIGLTPLQASIIGNRLDSSVSVAHLRNTPLSVIENPVNLFNAKKAAEKIALHIRVGDVIGLWTDYDVDGITSGTVMLKSLIDYFGHPAEKTLHIMGNRHTEGYGISQPAVTRIIQGIDNKDIVKPDVIITADCGSSDEERILQFKNIGIDVIVTDHHAIPASGVPSSAYTVVNPQQELCNYEDKTIAGVTVAWLVMSLVRNELIRHKYIPASTPKLGALLDYVCLGTVADAVSIASLTNRAIVNKGLKLINNKSRPCWSAMQLLLSQEVLFTEMDLGFKFGPRINASSRMADPYQAIRYLCAETIDVGLQHLKVLDQNNVDRRSVEKEMLIVARELLPNSQTDKAVVIFDDSFFHGVQGIVASRIVEQTGKPTVIFSPTEDENIVTGSGRTIDEINLEVAFKWIEKQSPGIHIKVGGHHGAFGCAVYKKDIFAYRNLLSQAVQQQTSQALAPTLKIDTLWSSSFDTFEKSLVEIQELTPFGRGFEAPVFQSSFEITERRFIGSPAVHAKFTFKGVSGELVDGIFFNLLKNESDCNDYPYKKGHHIKAVFEISDNTFKGKTTIQLLIRDICGTMS